MTRSMETSSKSTLKKRRLLSKIIFTEARAKRGASGEPFQIKSSVRLPRMDFTDCSPKTKRKASAMFDFPLPLGPTTAVIGVLNSRAVFLAKDLKPVSSRDFRYMTVFVSEFL